MVSFTPWSVSSWKMRLISPLAPPVPSSLAQAGLTPPPPNPFGLGHTLHPTLTSLLSPQHSAARERSRQGRSGPFIPRGDLECRL